MDLIRSFREAAQGVKSLLVGLGVTGKYFFRPQVTVHYPRATVPSLTGYRGHIELLPRLDDPAAPRCIACGTCARTCPSGCIRVTGDPEYAKRPDHPPVEIHAGVLVPMVPKRAPSARPVYQRPTVFQLDYTLCSLCGLCVESCPVNAIGFSSDVYVASESPDAYRYDLIGYLHDKTAKVHRAGH